MSGAMQTTVVLTPVVCGTEIHITQEGIPDVIPTAACYLGWQESLTLLAQLVEPEFGNRSRRVAPHCRGIGMSICAQHW